MKQREVDLVMTVEDCEKHEAELRQKLQLSENCEVDLMDRLQRSEKRQLETQQRLAIEMEKRLSVEAQLGSRPPAKRRALDEVFIDYFIFICFIVNWLHIVLKILFLLGLCFTAALSANITHIFE